VKALLLADDRRGHRADQRTQNGTHEWTAQPRQNDGQQLTADGSTINVETHSHFSLDKKIILVGVMTPATQVWRTGTPQNATSSP
jgi:hypothetical protein